MSNRQLNGRPGSGKPRGFLTHVAFLAIMASVTSGCSSGNATKPLVNLHEIASPAAPGSSSPNLFAAEHGRVYMSWIEPRVQAADAGSAAEYAVRFAVLDLETPAAADDQPESPRWSTPRTIAAGDDLAVWALPSMCKLPDGSLAAYVPVRASSEGYGVHVHLAQSTDGGRTWSEDVVPHRDMSNTEHAYVSLFPLHNGRLAAVWLDGREFAESGGAHGEDGSRPATTLRFTTISAAGERGAEVVLDGRVCSCCQTGAALTANGPIVVYRNRSQDEVRDIYAIRYVDSGWTRPEPVHADGWVIDACPVNGPAVAAAGRQVAVAWFTAADDVPRVQLAFSSDAGATFGPPVRVDDGSPAGRVDVVLLPDGGALVSWLERTPNGAAEIRVRRVEPPSSPAEGPTAGPSMMVTSSASAARASGFPRIVRAGDHVVFAWTMPGKPSTVHVAVAEIRQPAGTATGQ